MSLQPSTHATRGRTRETTAGRLVAAARRARAADRTLTLASLGLDDLVLPPTVLDAAAELMRAHARGHNAKILVLPETLSAQQAADLLGVSRPHLTMLLDRDRIPYRTTPGGHRRIERADVEAYRTQQDLARTAMNDAMTSTNALADDDR